MKAVQRRTGVVAITIGLLGASLLHAEPPEAFETATAKPTAEQEPVEFWFVEPGEGESAGGHAAIRIGERVYHVEHRGDGLIADRRADRRAFEELYRGRQNRRIEAVPLILAPADAVRLRARLEARYFERTLRLDRLDALDAQSRWLEGAIEKGYLAVAVPGLGLYEPISSESSSAACSASRAAPFAAFRRAVDRRHGPDWLDARRRSARDEAMHWLSRILDVSDDAEAARDSASQVGPGGVLRRFREAAQTWAAFEVLGGCTTLRLDRVHRASSGQEPSASHRSRWEQTRQALLERLLELLESNRKDLGLPILLTRARWEVVEHSIATGSLHVLDPIAGDEPHDARRSVASVRSLEQGLPQHWVPGFRRRAVQAWQRALRDYDADRGPLEAQLDRLEKRHHDLRHADRGTLHEPAPGRAASSSQTARYAAAEWLIPWPGNRRFSSLGEARDSTSVSSRSLRQAYRVDLDYGLFTQNCVTELMSELDRSPGLSPSRAEPRPTRPGWLDIATQVGFIPVVAAHLVEQSMPSEPRRQLASAREQALERERERARKAGGDALLPLRESMTLTSRTYRSHPADSSFLFFSDGPVWARPLFGIANLGYGVGATVLGIFTAPFDDGQGLRRGARGVVMSIPELFFFQVRQGSYSALPPLD